MKISISPSVFLMGAIILISGQFKQMLIPIAAALLHELGHISFAFLFNIKIERIEFNLFGAIIKVKPFSCSYTREAMLAAAGPLSNIMSIFTSILYIKYITGDSNSDIILFIVSSALFAIINLLPAEDFDGGRILYCYLLSRLPLYAATRALEWLSLLCVFFLWSLSVYFIIRTGSYLSLFIFSGSLFSKIFLLHERKRD